MGDHVCQCVSCAPGAFPSGERLREGHSALRFGDRDTFWWHLTHVFLNDTEVSNDAFEACPGPDGFVVVYTRDETGSKHFCSICKDDICSEVRQGDVRVETRSEGILVNV